MPRDIDLLQPAINQFQRTVAGTTLQPAGGIPQVRPVLTPPAVQAEVGQTPIPAPAPAPTPNGFASTDPLVQAKIKEMQRAVEEKSGAFRAAQILTLERQKKLKEMLAKAGEQQEAAQARATSTSAAAAAAGAAVDETLGAVEEEIASIFGESGLTSEEESLYRQARDLAAQQESDLTTQIRQDVEKQLQQSREAQRQATGATVSQFAKIGALGVTTATVQYLNDLDLQYQGKMNEINQAGQRAIERAKTARSEMDIKTLGIELENIRQNRQELRQAQQDKLDNLIKLQTIDKYKRDTVEETLGALIESGVGVGDLPEGYLDSFDKAMKLPQGTTALRYDTLGEIYSLEKQGSVVEAMTKLNNYLKTVPSGQTAKIGGQTYIGTDTGQIEINNATGDVYSLRSDPSSPSGFAVSKIGNIGAQTNRVLTQIYNPQTNAMEYWSVDPDDPSNALPVTITGSGGASDGGVDVQAMIEQFPADESFSFNDDGTPRSWCVEWLREISAGGSLPATGELDSIEQKAAFADATIGFGGDQRMPSAGDYVLTNEDSQNGHIALITQVKRDPSGNLVAVLAESNFKKGTVTYNRTLQLSEDNLAVNGGQIMGFHKAKLKPQYTSQPTSGLFSKQPSTALSELGRDYGVEYMRGAALGTIPEEYRDAAVDYALGLRSKFADRPEIKAFKKVATAIQGLGQRKLLEGDLYAALDAGDDQLVREIIKESVYQSSGQDTKGKIDGRIQTSEQLRSVQKMFDEYEKLGYDTGVFKGSAEKVLSKVGRMSDPQARRIANSIAITLIEFRKNYTGVAFSPQESEQYERVLPSIGNIPEVNRAVIDSLVSTFDLSNETFYRSRVGDDYYDSLFPKEPTLDDYLDTEGL